MKPNWEYKNPRSTKNAAKCNSEKKYIHENASQCSCKHTVPWLFTHFQVFVFLYWLKSLSPPLSYSLFSPQTKLHCIFLHCSVFPSLTHSFSAVFGLHHQHHHHHRHISKNIFNESSHELCVWQVFFSEITYWMSLLSSSFSSTRNALEQQFQDVSTKMRRKKKDEFYI
jgi:hypothetical protein